ncbi:Peroxisomal membrane anchor protein (Pex14p) conserved region [Geosmithia morbida]|uniref:Peroxisomal membrane protein PEX14 n=1 Tax=Geosmithia morbida TaxID=1094350 RepID=A0A9P4YQK7_9HYPO|nr:Peroxisomal membrane anchor protein (Pex14p) conserved region [Geosmithia morbida]KAF4120945.1 Peroxisomal membrane anchor protein (Pex14p) conserved region [Geosmithia morbida]
MAGEKKDSPTIPDWQRSQDDNSASEPSTSQDDGQPADTQAAKSDDNQPATQPENTSSDDDALTVAHRFLEDDEVRSAPREKKEAFLKAKGISDDDIVTLLGQPDSPSTTPAETEPSSSSSTTAVDSTNTSILPLSDRAPVVTYPEFLTKPTSPSPPPLVTTGRLLATLQVTAALSAIVAGSSRFIFSPMLEQLTASREDLYGDASGRLDSLVHLLEKSVSVIPAAGHRDPNDDANANGDASASDEDPTEMFHRDIGTQTLLPVPSVADAPKPSPHESQAARLTSLSRSLADIARGIRSQSDGLTDTKSLVDVLRDDLDILTYRNPLGGGRGPMNFTRGSATKMDENDEIRRVRDNIRRVKGVLLSSRSFPSR